MRRGRTCRSCSTTTTLDRLTAATGPVAARSAEALSRIPLRNSQDCILSLPALLALVNGYVPLVLEVKSTWSRDGTFEANIAHMLASYQGPVAVMSFDPYSLKAFREAAPLLPRGLVADRFDDESHWSQLTLVATDCHAQPAHRPPSPGPTSSPTISRRCRRSRRWSRDSCSDCRC